jgi:hypothetical protein
MEEYTKNDHFDNPLTPPTPNNLARLSEYQTRNPEAEPGEWTPRASGALRRHAAAYDKFLHDEERKRLADRRAA